MLISYGASDVIGVGTNSDVDTTEEDVVVITDPSKLQHSQATIYPTITLGTNTSITLRVYFQSKPGGTWVQESQKNASTSAIEGSSYVYSSPLDLPINIPIPACFGMKVTAQGIGGANSSVTVEVLARNN